MVTPVGFLLLALAGMVPGDPLPQAGAAGALDPGQLGFCSSPSAPCRTRPGHDGVRLFLPAFGVLALLVGIGARQLLDWFGPWARGLRRRRRRGRDRERPALHAGAALLFQSRSWEGSPARPGWAWSPPTTGTRWTRKREAGSEPTRGPARPSSSRRFRHPGSTFARLASCRRVHSPFDPGPPAWYVLQNRPGAWLPIDRQLVEQSTPAFQVRKIGRAPGLGLSLRRG